MAKQIGNKIATLNVGKLIRTEQLRQRITHALLARRVNRSQSTIKKVLYNTSIQTYLV